MARYNEQALDLGLSQIGIGAYVTSSEFAVDVAENWQSEYLQFLLYIVLTVWLVQRGSPESKPLDAVGRESDKDQLVGEYAKPDSPAWAKAAGWRRALFSSSMGLMLGLIFVFSWTAQFVAGRSAYNAEQHGRVQHLSARARIAGVQARRHPACGHRRRELTTTHPRPQHKTQVAPESQHGP